MGENNDDFDEIVNGQEDDSGAENVEFEHIMEVVEFFYKKLNPGHIFVKGMIIVESVAPEGRGNCLESSSPITDADILGFCEWGKAKVIADINAQGWAEAMALMAEDEEDEDSEGDSE